MIRPRRLTLPITLAAVALGCLAALLAMESWADDGAARFRRLRDGMTREEAEAVMGGPPSPWPGAPHWPAGVRWDVCGGTAYVTFDSGGKVGQRYFTHDLPAPTSPWEGFRAWLGW